LIEVGDSLGIEHGEKYKYDAFLSCNSIDSKRVAIIARKLKDEGIKDLQPEMPWKETIELALRTSKVVVVFVGTNGFKNWENEDVRSVINMQIAKPDIAIISVLLPKASARSIFADPVLSKHSAVVYQSSLDDVVAFHRLLLGVLGKNSDEHNKGIEEDLYLKGFDNSKLNELKYIERLANIIPQTLGDSTTDAPPPDLRIKKMVKRK
jgi:hypothetical protein